MRRPVHLGSIAALTATLALGLLSGCGNSDDEPKEPDPQSSSTHSTPKNDLRVPELPDQARQYSTEGAAAFVGYYVELLNYARATGDTAPAESVSSPNCESCTNFTDEVSRIYSTGGAVNGGEWTLSDLSLTSPNSPMIDATGTVSSAAGEQSESINATTVPFPGESVEITFRVDFSVDKWLMTEFAGVLES